MRTPQPASDGIDTSGPPSGTDYRTAAMIDGPADWRAWLNR